MKQYGIGSALLYFRTKYNISQIELAEGIFPRMTISRIEAEKYEYDSLEIETLMSRLGKTTDTYEFLLDMKDYELCELRNEMKRAWKQQDTLELKKFLGKYQSNMPQRSILHQQVSVFYRAVLSKLTGGTKEQLEQELILALSLTKPAYFSARMKKQLYSAMEVMILCELNRRGKLQKDKLNDVMQFMEEFYDVELKNPPIISR